jgi:outer membrane receptor protein involved in Fe transport
LNHSNRNRRDRPPFSRILFCVLFAGAPLGSAWGQAVSPEHLVGDSPLPDNVEDLSLEDLLEVAAGTLTGTTADPVPVTVTTITAEEIELSPARNIYDLIEIYVPGAFVLNHNEDLHPGIRGIVGDRNYKFLLLINGRNMNQKGHMGATAELENWDLQDIERIEIIRGPGSVTYGPGAIMGVIDIVTKDARTGETEATLGYVAPYGSRRASVSAAHRGRAVEIYAHASVVQTSGVVNPTTYAGDKLDNVGYVGADFPTGSPYVLPPQTYLRDFRDHPQVKVHLSAKVAQELELWARYTSSGIPTPRSGAGAASQQVDPSGNLLDFKGFTDRRLTLTAEDVHPFGQLTMRSMVSWSLEDFNQFESIVNPSDLGSLQNNKIRFSEAELFGRVLAVLRHGVRKTSALGVEYSRLSFGPGVGTDADSGFKMGDGSDIVSGPASQSVDPAGKLLGGNGTTTPIFAGNGWSTNALAALGETSLEFHKLFTVLGSARLDKNTYSRYLFSPRLVVMSRFGNGGVLKGIVQQSKRMNTAEQLYVEHRAGGTSAPETLTGYELAYTVPIAEPLSLSTSGFYNQAQILAWNGKDATVRVGDLSLYGVEGEARYSRREATVAISQSFVGQVKWKLATGQTGSGISYSDYNRPVDMANGVTMTGFGNNLNNVPQSVTKAYATYTLAGFTGHLDARVLWGWAGYKDGLTSLQNAAAGTPKQAAVEQALAATDGTNLYGVDFRLNASLRYRLWRTISVSAYVMNLLGNGQNKRYSYDAGINSASPNRIGWVSEPRAFGLQVTGRL